MTKVPGPRNPGDMGTKNILVAAMELYLDQLNLAYANGRAAIAQKLHFVGEIGNLSPQSSVWRAGRN